jgi:hypothetical protein
VVTIEWYITINGVRFRDVTDTTFVGPGYSYEEAYALTQGRRVYCSPPQPEHENEEWADPDPFWKGLPKYKKRRKRQKRRA